MRAAASVIVLAFCAGVAASVAAAQPADAPEDPRLDALQVAVEVGPPLAAEGRQVAAELRSAGFEVIVRPLGGVPLEAFTEEGGEGPLAVVRLLLEGGDVRVGLADALTAKTLTRRMERGPDLGLRGVELLHAALLEIRAAHFAARAAPAPPAAVAFVDAGVTEERRPLSIGLGLGLWLDDAARLSGATQLAVGGARGHFYGEALAEVALTPWQLEDPRGRTRVHAALFGGAAGYQWTPGPLRVALLGGGGLALLWANAEPSEGFVARAVRDLDGYLEAALLLRVVRRRLAYDFRATTGVLLAGVPVTVEQESVESIVRLRGPVLRLTFRVAFRP